ncbi:MAG: isoprenoid biosynthesis glyoxalase ElbB [Pseudomonadota bacterium]
MSLKSSNHPESGGVALVLAGCGAKDGSEITEAVSLLVALSQHGYKVQCFAPDRSTHDVINHLNGQQHQTMRNQLEESARIARGQVKPLSELKAQNYAAVVVAGGFGVVKNLCNFASAGREATLQGDVRAALLPFLTTGKPCAALCIAPVVLALLCKEAGYKGADLTLGSGAARDAVMALEFWGAHHVPTRPGQACIDTKHRLVTAPAYMYDDATPADVFASAEALVKGLSNLLENAHRGS